jgi:hypothetical protein
MTARALLARVLKVSARVLAAVTLLAAMEGQIFAYGVFLLRHKVEAITQTQVSAPTPESVLAALHQPDESNLTFLAVGDIARCARTDLPGRLLPATSDRLGWHRPMVADHADPTASASLARQWPDAPILAVGDLVYARGTPGEFADCYERAWGDLRARILPAPGNHEYGTPGAFGYFDYWGAQAGPDQRGYYALRWRNWLILSLNSEVDASAGSPQEAWLTQELAKAPGACIMAFFHKPAHSLQGPRRDQHNAERLFAQVQQAAASFVINGHNHFYERTRPLDSSGAVVAAGGTIGFTVGTGGIEGPATHAAALPAQTAAAIFGSIGLLRVQLSDSGFAWWFHQAQDRAVMDHGTAPCGAQYTAL